MNKEVNQKFMPLPLIIYIIGWLYFAYLFNIIYNFKSIGSSDLVVTGMFYLDLLMHEGSHFMTMFLPQIYNAAAGSIGAMLIAILALVSTIRSKTYFASVFVGLWIMLSMASASIYMADAHSQLLPLIGGGTNHDWAYVFGQLGWLKQDIFIASIVRGIGNIIGISAMVFGLFLIFMKIKPIKKPVRATNLVKI